MTLVIVRGHKIGLFYCVVWVELNVCRLAFTRRGAERLKARLERRYA